MSYMGIGANTLGYADEDVDKAVIECISKREYDNFELPRRS